MLRTDEFVLKNCERNVLTKPLLKRRQGSREDLNFLENPRSVSSKKKKEKERKGEKKRKEKKRKEKKRSHLNRCIVSDGPAIYTLWMVFQWFSSVQYLLKTLDALSRCSSSLPPTTLPKPMGLFMALTRLAFEVHDLCNCTTTEPRIEMPRETIAISVHIACSL